MSVRLLLADRGFFPVSRNTVQLRGVRERPLIKRVQRRLTERHRRMVKIEAVNPRPVYEHIIRRTGYHPALHISPEPREKRIHGRKKLHHRPRVPGESVIIKQHCREKQTVRRVEHHALVHPDIVRNAHEIKSCQPHIPERRVSHHALDHIVPDAPERLLMQRAVKMQRLPAHLERVTPQPPDICQLVVRTFKNACVLTVNRVVLIYKAYIDADVLRGNRGHLTHTAHHEIRINALSGRDGYVKCVI